MYERSADHLKVTWYIIRLKKNMVYKNTQGGGGGVRLSAHGLYVRDSKQCIFLLMTFHHHPLKASMGHHRVLYWAPNCSPYITNNETCKPTLNICVCIMCFMIFAALFDFLSFGGLVLYF